MEKELLETAFYTMLNNSTDMIFIKDINLVYQSASMPFVKMVGKNSADEIIGHTDNEIFAEKELAKRYERDDRKIIARGKDVQNFVEPITDEDGHPRYGSTSKYLLRGKDDQVMGILGITKDITMEYMARQHYQQQFKYLFDLPEDTYAVCYIDVDDWRIIKQRRQQIKNGTLQEAQTVEEICEYAIASIRDKSNAVVEFYENFTAARLWGIFASGRRSMTYEYERELSDGTYRWVHNEVHLLTDVDSGHLCAMLSAKDISKNKFEEQKIMTAAKLDQMTRVLNRETAMECIRQILERETKNLHALLMLDVDNFKGLNDTLGHQAGDEFLIELAKRLKGAFRENDVVGRIGGDEFFVFLCNVTEINQIEKKAQGILQMITDIAEKYPQVALGGSIGISLYPGNGKDLETLYASADKALYSAKNSGKNRFGFAK